MNVDLAEVRKKTVTVQEYIDGLEQPFKEKYLARMQTYELQHETIERLKDFAGKYMAIVFSATWCKDCAQNVPVLALIAESTELEVRVFKGLKRDPLSHTDKWRIPPSPPEVRNFGVDGIPLIVMVDEKGREIGRIVESPSDVQRWNRRFTKSSSIGSSCFLQCGVFHGFVRKNHRTVTHRRN